MGNKQQIQHYRPLPTLDTADAPHLSKSLIISSSSSQAQAACQHFLLLHTSSVIYANIYILPPTNRGWSIISSFRISILRSRSSSTNQQGKLELYTRLYFKHCNINIISILILIFSHWQLLLYFCTHILGLTRLLLFSARLLDTWMPNLNPHYSSSYQNNWLILIHIHATTYIFDAYDMIIHHHPTNYFDTWSYIILRITLTLIHDRTTSSYGLHLIHDRTTSSYGLYLIHDRTTSSYILRITFDTWSYDYDILWTTLFDTWSYYIILWITSLHHTIPPPIPMQHLLVFYQYQTLLDIKSKT